MYGKLGKILTNKTISRISLTLIVVAFFAFYRMNSVDVAVADTDYACWNHECCPYGSSEACDDYCILNYGIPALECDTENCIDDCTSEGLCDSGLKDCGTQYCPYGTACGTGGCSSSNSCGGGSAKCSGYGNCLNNSLPDGATCYYDDECENLCDETSNICCPTGDCCSGYSDSGDADCSADKYCNQTYDCTASLSEGAACVAPRDKMCHSTNSGGDCVNDQDGEGTYCSCTGNGCVDDGSCYADTSAHDIGGGVGDGADYEYCDSGTWLDADETSTACLGVGGEVYYSSGSKCCGDDGLDDNFGAYTGLSGSNRFCCVQGNKVNRFATAENNLNYRCGDGSILYCMGSSGEGDGYGWSEDVSPGGDTTTLLYIDEPEEYGWQNCGITFCSGSGNWTRLSNHTSIVGGETDAYALLNSDVILDTNIMLSYRCGYLNISNGKTLTVSEDVEIGFLVKDMGIPGYIIIEQGGKLVLMGNATLTNYYGGMPV